jgi:ribosomal protein S18 acetylase RimI-like enzyme
MGFRLIARNGYLKAVLKQIARVLVGEYSIFKIYGFDGSPAPLSTSTDLMLAKLQDTDELAQSDSPELRELTDYGGEGAHGFGAWVDGHLAAACWFWVGERYKNHQVWPLADKEAKLVRIATCERFRGRGIASALIGFGVRQMRQGGYRRFYAKIWHSNQPSIAAFSKAGWRHVSTVCNVAPFGKKICWRFTRYAWQRPESLDGRAEPSPSATPSLKDNAGIP